MPDESDKLKSEFFSKLEKTKAAVKACERDGLKVPSYILDGLRKAELECREIDERLSHGGTTKRVSKLMRRMVYDVNHLSLEVEEFRVRERSKNDLEGASSRNLFEVKEAVENKKLPYINSPEPRTLEGLHEIASAIRDSGKESRSVEERKLKLERTGIVVNAVTLLSSAIISVIVSYCVARCKCQ